MKWYKVLVGTLIASVLMAGTINIGGPNRVEVLSKAPGYVKVSMGLDKLNYREFKLEGRTFTRFELQDIGEIWEVGKPNLPAIRRFVEGPYNATPEVKVVRVEKEVYKLEDLGIQYPIMPTYPSVPKIKGAKPKLVIDENIYKTDAYFPDRLVEIKEAGIVRGHDLYLLSFYPVRYNPVKNEIEVIKSIEVEVNFKGGDDAKAYYEIERKYSPYFERFLSHQIINYGVYEPKNLNPAAPVGYVIITPSEFVSALEPLILWKKQMGYHVVVATIPDSIASGDTTSVKAYIQNAYDNWTVPPTFVVLVGDVAQIGNWWSTAQDNPANDLGYALTDGTDYLPDIYVGRLSATTDSMVGVIVDKIVTYEKTLWGDTLDWAQKAFFIASADGGHHQIAEGTHNYCIQIVRNHGMVVDSLYAYYVSDAHPYIAPPINEGRALVTYSGHGGTDGWADYNNLEFPVSDIYSELNNGFKTPFVQTYACLTGSYANTSECGMEAWLRAPNKGAVASMGSSVTSLWDEDDILQRRLFDELFDTGYVWVMGAINAAKMDFYEHYGDNTGNVATIRYFQQYNLFGDPSTYIFTNQPLEFTVNVPPSIPYGNVSINVNVSDANGPVEGAFVSATQNGVLLDADYTDGGGNVVLNLSISTPDTVYITTTGWNHRPSIVAVIPSGAGAYIGISSYVLDDAAGGNGDNILNPGEDVYLDITAKNWGQDSAYNVYAKLLTSDSYVSIVNDSAYFGDFTPADSSGDSVSVDNAFEFSLPYSVPDGHVVQITVMFVFEDTGAVDTTYSHLAFTVKAPSLVSVGKILVRDTFPGDNGDNVLQPGEKAELIIPVKNVGNADISDIIGNFATSDSYVNVIKDTAFYGNIPVDSIGKPVGTGFIVEIDSSTPIPHLADVVITYSNGNYTFVDTLSLFIGNTGYFTEVELGDTSEWYMSGEWHISQRRAHSVPYSFFFGTETGDYGNNANDTLLSPYITIGPNARLIFWTFYKLEHNYDKGYLEISVDSGATWTVLDQFTDSTTEWVKKEYDLSSITPGTDILIRFRATSDGSVTREGWYIDDIRVTPPEAPTHLSLIEVAIIDTSGNNNGVLDPGETAELVLKYANDGENATNVVVSISTSVSYLILNDSVCNVGDIATGDTGTAIFTISADSSAPITEVDLTSFITANGGSYMDTIPFTISIGDKRMLYMGPDAYGYYIYDSEDGYSETPHYQWVEISTLGTVVADEDDGTEKVQLPFTFKYYGVDYDTISICSNGWIAFGTTSLTAYSNVGIPNTQTPNNIVAVYWDDLKPTYTTSGKIYYYADTVNHRVIVEWDSVSFYGAENDRVKVEVILYDPAYYPTRTGDGEILIQFATAPAQEDATVGMENNDGTIGLQVFYNGEYNEHAFPFVGGHALKMTTDTPVWVGVEEALRRHIPKKLTLYAIYPNPFRGYTSIRFGVPAKMKVELAVYDIMGRKVRTLMNGYLKPGIYTVRWDGRDKRGVKMPAGIYFFMLRTKDNKLTRKLIMVR